MAPLKWTTHTALSIRRRPEVRREEYLDFMTFQRNDRPLFTELFGPMLGLKEEWEAQGATPAELDFSAFRYRCEERWHVPVVTGRLGGFPEIPIEETDDFRIWRDGLGRTMKLSKRVATLPIPLDHPVRTMDDWMRVRQWYAYSDARFLPDWDTATLRARQEGKVVCVSIPGGFDEPRQLMGEEGLCTAYYDRPELVHDILQTIGDTARRVLARVSAAVQVDLLSVHEDMAGNLGPLAGPLQVREFIAPYYRAAWEPLAERGARLFEQDSDGNIAPVIDTFLEAGVNVMFPMEARAGMDIVALRKKYGRRLAFAGGIDKFCLLSGPEAIRKELEYKVPPMVASGGCVLSLDHRILTGTPLPHYRFYISTAWELMERASGGG